MCVIIISYYVFISLFSCELTLNRIQIFCRLFNITNFDFLLICVLVFYTKHKIFTYSLSLLTSLVQTFKWHSGLYHMTFPAYVTSITTVLYVHYSTNKTTVFKCNREMTYSKFCEIFCIRRLAGYLFTRPN